ncbi:hypothetical protein ACHQM5_030486 [Ranunculus cassubicifolius]
MGKKAEFKEPCKKEACDIQACLSKNNFNSQSKQTKPQTSLHTHKISSSSNHQKQKELH